MKPYLEKEADDRSRVLKDVMQLLAEGILQTHSGACRLQLSLCYIVRPHRPLIDTTRRQRYHRVQAIAGEHAQHGMNACTAEAA